MLAPRAISPKKTVILAAILCVALGGIAFLLYDHFVRVNTGSIPAQWSEEFSRTSKFRYPPVPAFKAEDALFDSPQYKQLRAFASLPVQVGPLGRTNPFAPPAFASGTSALSNP